MLQVFFMVVPSWREGEFEEEKNKLKILSNVLKQRNQIYEERSLWSQGLCNHGMGI